MLLTLDNASLYTSKSLTLLNFSLIQLALPLSIYVHSAAYRGLSRIDYFAMLSQRLKISGSQFQVNKYHFPWLNAFKEALRLCERLFILPLAHYVRGTENNILYQDVIGCSYAA